MIGVVIPAHNEAATLDRCLSSVVRASRHVELDGELVQIVVVLDGCTDESAEIVARFAGQFGVIALASTACNVGRARAMGADFLLSTNARWLTFTDADSIVSERWLVEHLALQSDAVCGTVVVEDWSGFSDLVRQEYDAHYCQADGHHHIHGANFGVSAAAYLRAGGFAPLAAHEDVALVHALEASGARIAWSAKPGVVTSARMQARAPEGFAGYLRSLQAQVLGMAESLDLAKHTDALDLGLHPASVS